MTKKPEPAKVEIDTYHRHELLHAAWMLHESWDSFIERHKAVQANPELKAAAENIGDMTARFYQLVGQTNFTADNEEGVLAFTDPPKETDQ